MWEQNSYLTLTYNDENLPEHGHLRHRDFQLFMKKLRKHVVRNLPKSKTEPTKGTPPLSWYTTERREINFPKYEKRKATLPINYVSYYMAGEYGSRRKRPHYHAIIFGWEPNDKTYEKKNKQGHKLFKSKTLEKIWGLGDVIIGEVTFESAAYVARYITTKVTGPKADRHYEAINEETGEITNRPPEYNKMSLRPAIGARWFKKFKTDIYPEGQVRVRSSLNRTPKYYDKLYKETDPDQHDQLKANRELEAEQKAADNTPERLADKEKVTLARTKSLTRTME